MSIKSRVRKLETTSGQEYQAVIPVMLDSSGNRFEKMPDKSHVSAAMFKADDAEQVIARKPGEEFWDFSTRVMEEIDAYVEFGCVSPLGVEFL